MAEPETRGLNRTMKNSLGKMKHAPTWLDLPGGTCSSLSSSRLTLRNQSGQTTVEFSLTYLAVILPLTFGLVFVSEILWVWHGVNDFTRRGAGYASTHCWEGSAGNVLDFMHSNLPPTIDQNRFRDGPAQIKVTYFAKDPASGALIPFQCSSDCSISCIPDTVTVSVVGYAFATFVTYLGLPPVPLPDFRTSVPMESAGCDPEQGVCLP